MASEIERLAETLNESSRVEVLETLLALTAAQRKTLGPQFRRSLRGFERDLSLNRDMDALGVVATADGARQAALLSLVGWRLSQECVEDIVAILGARSPGWLPQFVPSVLSEAGPANWRIARAMVRAGLVGAPDDEEYYRGTVRGVPQYFPHHHWTLVDRLDLDPELIGDHLITMLSTEGAGRLLSFHDHFVDDPRQRASGESFPAGTWREALLTLTRQQRLNRDTLLDTVLAAPLRDWAAADLGWFVEMHQALKPGSCEILARQAVYARLLTVAHGPSVTMAQQSLACIVGNAGFEPGPVVEASLATFGRPAKAAAVAQLRLLEKVHAAHPQAEIAQVVRVATEHSRADVREQAEKLLTRLGAASASASLEGFVAPTPVPRPPAAPIEPVRSADDLAEVLLQLLEEVDPIAMERAIDGLLRYADDRPNTASLLLDRADAVDGVFDASRMAVVLLVRAWLTPRTQGKKEDWTITLAVYGFPDKPALPGTSVGAMARRLSMIADAVRTRPHPSVALPSRADGSIDVEALNGRLRQYDPAHGPTEFECALAVLRVRPDDRGSIAVPAALHDSRPVTRALQTPAATWVRKVVSYQRRSYEEKHRIPTYRDLSAVEGDALDGILARRRPGRTVGKEIRYGTWDGQLEHTLAMTALLNPHDVDTIAAHAHPFLYRDLHKPRAVGVPLIDAIARARSVTGPPACSALVLGLGAKDARARTAAQDALLDLAQYGLLDGVRLGEQAALHLTDQIVVGGRVSAGFASVADASDAAVLPVLDALRELMPALPGRKDAGPFVELAAQLSERTGTPVELPLEYQAMAAGRSSSMLATAIRRLT